MKVAVADVASLRSALATTQGFIYHFTNNNKNYQ